MSVCNGEKSAPRISAGGACEGVSANDKMKENAEEKM